MNMRLYIAFLVIILFSACVQQEIHAIKIPGHGQQVYTFASDIRKALNVKINNPEYIRNLFYNTRRINIVFNGSSTTDNAYFQVIMIDFGKVPLYLAYEGRFVDLHSYYFLNRTWYNETGDEIQKPELKDPTLWLIGPNTGANETSIMLHDNIVYLQGTSYDKLRLVNDRLVLAIMNINSIKDI